MQRRRREDGGPEAEEERAARPAAPSAPLLALQQSAGNAAVSRMLQRKEFNPFAVDLRDSEVGRGIERATDAVKDLVDARARGAGPAGIVESVPELVAAARELPGVADHYQPADVERIIRERAKFIGAPLSDSRSADDPKGVAAEAVARLKNLAGKIPTEVTIGGDDATITIGIGGTATARVKSGGTTFEGEVSKDGGKATVKHGGTKVGVEVGQNSVKLDLKAGDLAIKGSVERSGEHWKWKADVQIGTLGKVLGAEDIAKVLSGAQTSLGGAAQDLADGLQVADVTKHGAAVKEAVSGAVEKAKKSAQQGGRGGWQVGVSVQGGGKEGGVAGMVTLTWHF